MNGDAIRKGSPGQYRRDTRNRVKSVHWVWTICEKQSEIHALGTDQGRESQVNVQIGRKSSQSEICALGTDLGCEFQVNARESARSNGEVHGKGSRNVQASTFAISVTVIDNSRKFGKVESDGSEDDNSKWR